jgi:hypothetical protein
MQKVTTTLKDGTPVIGVQFDELDYQKFKDIFKSWLDMNKSLQSLGGRSMNVPDVISEGVYCHLFNAVRTNGTGRSYDAVDLQTHEGVQVKSTSIENDVTSFGPTSTWDVLIFMDFAPSGVVDGRVDIYRITTHPGELILNRKKGETFTDQQSQGRRPRLSIKSQIINPEGLKPIMTISLLDQLEEVPLVPTE